MDSVRKNRKPIPLSALHGPEGWLPGLGPYGCGTVRTQKARLTRPGERGPAAHLAGVGEGTHIICGDHGAHQPWRRKAFGTFQGSGFESGLTEQCATGGRRRQLPSGVSQDLIQRVPLPETIGLDLQGIQCPLTGGERSQQHRPGQEYQQRGRTYSRHTALITSQHREAPTCSN